MWVAGDGDGAAIDDEGVTVGMLGAVGRGGKAGELGFLRNQHSIGQIVQRDGVAFVFLCGIQTEGDAEAQEQTCRSSDGDELIKTLGHNGGGCFSVDHRSIADPLAQASAILR